MRLYISALQFLMLINHHRTIHHIAYTSPSSKYMYSKALGCICMSSLMDIENKSNQLYPKREMYIKDMNNSRAKLYRAIQTQRKKKGPVAYTHALPTTIRRHVKIIKEKDKHEEENVGELKGQLSHYICGKLYRCSFNKVTWRIYMARHRHIQQQQQHSSNAFTISVVRLYTHIERHYRPTQNI